MQLEKDVGVFSFIDRIIEKVLWRLIQLGGELPGLFVASALLFLIVSLILLILGKWKILMIAALIKFALVSPLAIYIKRRRLLPANLYVKR